MLHAQARAKTPHPHTQPHIPGQVNTLENSVEALQMVVGGGDLLQCNPCLLRYLDAASKRPAFHHRHPRLVEVREVVPGEPKHHDRRFLALLQSLCFGSLDNG